MIPLVLKLSSAHAWLSCQLGTPKRQCTPGHDKAIALGCDVPRTACAWCPLLSHLPSLGDLPWYKAELQRRRRAGTVTRSVGIVTVTWRPRSRPGTAGMLLTWRPSLGLGVSHPAADPSKPCLASERRRPSRPFCPISAPPPVRMRHLSRGRAQARWRYGGRVEGAGRAGAGPLRCPQRKQGAGGDEEAAGARCGLGPPGLRCAARWRCFPSIPPPAGRGWRGLSRHELGRSERRRRQRPSAVRQLQPGQHVRGWRPT